MDVDTFVLLQKRRLEEDKRQLKTRQSSTARGSVKSEVSSFGGDHCEALYALPNDRNLRQNCIRDKDDVEKCNFQQSLVENRLRNDDGGASITPRLMACHGSVNEPSGVPFTYTFRGSEGKKEQTMSMATVQRKTTGSTATPEIVINVSDLRKEFGRTKEDTSQALSKNEKDLANHKECSAATVDGTIQDGSRFTKRKDIRARKKDDMDQWVSDTFYSYFPGFNNEYQKRQHVLRERQRENQENYLKHQMLNPPVDKGVPVPLKASRLAADGGATLTAAHIAGSTDKTDLEIIVNNPNYVPKYRSTSPRPGSTRHKLLQDLRHTELSNIVSGNGVVERNRHMAEMELARKKDYQQELMQQINEKRRSIEALREKERHEDEILTRRLQEQLKTIHLEEELQKEKVRAQKLRFDSEQNRLMREHLLAELDSDAKMVATSSRDKDQEGGSSVVSSKASATQDAHKKNRVYKFFSNSARHEFRRDTGLPSPQQHDFDLKLSETPPNTERECFHLSEKICPKCVAPLKSYASCCLRCHRKVPSDGQSISGEDPRMEKNSNDGDDEGTNRSFSMVCSNCERLYKLCQNCLVKSDVCRSCHRERNVCMNCRRSLCSFCLDEIACGRDVERHHINEERRQDNKHDLSADQSSSKSESAPSESERGFHVVEMQCPSQKLTDNMEIFKTQILTNNNNNNNNNNINNNNINKNDVNVHIKSPNNSNNNSNNNNNNNNNNNININSNSPSYPINIERNSIFDPDSAKVRPSLEPFFNKSSVEKNIKLVMEAPLVAAHDSEKNIERIRNDTDQRLSRYLKNYGDLAMRTCERSRHQGTQTTPTDGGRRDVVLRDGNHLSMPLLREMPKMTRKETTRLLQMTAATNERKKMDNLMRRWEIPAVQTCTVSPTSPRVLTQLGAVRKNLQMYGLGADGH